MSRRESRGASADSDEPHFDSDGPRFENAKIGYW